MQNPKILVSNDDGINSMGIDALATEAKKWGELIIISPASQQTARAKALTFHKPIRIFPSNTISGHKGDAYSTLPADSVIICEHLYGKPDIVLSGINAGENTSIHSILTSGTCAVAMEGGLKNIPSFAFSIDTPEIYFQGNVIPGNLLLASQLSVKIAKLCTEQLEERFWKSVLFVNVNFPDELNEDTKIVLCDLETFKYHNMLHDREDPKGDKYYWLWGKKRKDFDEKKDTGQVYINKNIAISPVSFIDHEYLFSAMKKLIPRLNS